MFVCVRASVQTACDAKVHTTRWSHARWEEKETARGKAVVARSTGRWHPVSCRPLEAYSRRAPSHKLQARRTRRGCSSETSRPTHRPTLMDGRRQLCLDAGDLLGLGAPGWPFSWSGAIVAQTIAPNVCDSLELRSGKWRHLCLRVALSSSRQSGCLHQHKVSARQTRLGLTGAPTELS